MPRRVFPVYASDLKKGDEINAAAHGLLTIQDCWPTGDGKEIVVDGRRSWDGELKRVTYRPGERVMVGREVAGNEQPPEIRGRDGEAWRVIPHPVTSAQRALALQELQAIAPGMAADALMTRVDRLADILGAQHVCLGPAEIDTPRSAG